MITFDLLLTIFLFVLAFSIPIIILFAVQNFLTWKFMVESTSQIDEMRKEIKQQIEIEFKKMY